MRNQFTVDWSVIFREKGRLWRVAEWLHPYSQIFTPVILLILIFIEIDSIQEITTLSQNKQHEYKKHFFKNPETKTSRANVLAYLVIICL